MGSDFFTAELLQSEWPIKGTKTTMVEVARVHKERKRAQSDDQSVHRLQARKKQKLMRRTTRRKVYTGK